MVATAGGHPPVAVGYGGRDRLIGANPIVACFPTGDESPLLVDMATTSVAVGKIMVAAARGEQVPPGILVDASGAPTSDSGRVRCRRGADPLRRAQGVCTCSV